MAVKVRAPRGMCLSTGTVSVCTWSKEGHEEGGEAENNTAGAVGMGAGVAPVEGYGDDV